MIDCVLVTKFDGTIIYSAHYRENQSLQDVQEAEASIYRLTNHNWNQAKGKNFEVASSDGTIIVYTNVEDLLFFAVCSPNELFEDDEMSLMELINRIIDSLTAICGKKPLTSANLLEQYPLVCLTLSELVRCGIVDQLDLMVADDLAQFKVERSKK